MKFETIKNKKKILLVGIILFCVGVTLILTSSLAAYKTTQTIKIAEGTVNYIIPDMKMIALKLWNEETLEYDIDIDVMPSGSEYALSSESYCEVLGEKDENVMLFTNSLGQHVISNIQKNSKCYFYFLPKLNSTILANSTWGSGTPNFANTSCTAGTNNGGDCDEQTVGLYCWDVDTNEQCTSTSTNETYFYRGDVNDNYVEFAGYYWRIIRINSNGTIRMIYAGDADVIDALSNKEEVLANGYNDSVTEYTRIGTSDFNEDYFQAEYVGFKYTLGSVHGTSTKSTILEYLETWYASEDNELKNYDEYLDTESGFCGDRSVTSGTGIGTDYTTYGAYTRLSNSNPTPTFECPNEEDLYKTKIGLITEDEVVFAGGKYNVVNNSYYLYTGNYYWTLSPSYFGGTYARVFSVLIDGSLLSGDVNYSRGGVRPVINLSAKNLTITGSGTIQEPYVIS